MLTIQQLKAATTTTEVKTYPVPSFWKSNDYYPKWYALLAPDLVMLITNVTGGGQPAISIQTRLFGSDNPETEIQADEWSAEYEAAQLAIVDAFQTAFPQAVNLEMSER